MVFNEDLGLMFMEVMSWGKFVVVVNKGGLKEVVVDGEIGYLVEGELVDFVMGIVKLVVDVVYVEVLGLVGVKCVKCFIW